MKEFQSAIYLSTSAVGMDQIGVVGRPGVHEQHIIRAVVFAKTIRNH